jgi:alpha-1,2-mannosyltransferase
MTRASATHVALLLRGAYIAALVGAVLFAALVVLAAAANGTLGFDYRAYDLAVDRLLAGRSMYDESAQATGSFGLFFYPPPFALLILPFALLPTDFGVWLWTTALVTATLAAIWLLPVPARVRWVVLLLAALSWPLVYAIKLGQVGPMLLLLFAVGWRWMDRPWPLGIAAGLGTVIKLQPAILIGWAVVTGRRRAAVLAILIAGALALVATVVAGSQSWLEEASLLGRVSKPVLTPNAFGFGRLAYEAGFSEGAATLVHWANLALVLLLVAVVTWRGSATASYVAVVIASQFISPVLWDHYALILLLPVAWLLHRGQWWAVVIPLVTATFLVGITPPIAYPIAFWLALLAVARVGIREHRAVRPSAPGLAPWAPPAASG